MAQGVLQVQSTSPLSGTTLVTQLNAGLAGVASLLSGPVAPTLGPGSSGALVPCQLWADSSPPSGFIVVRFYTGSAWKPTFLFNAAPSCAAMHAGFGGM